MKWMRSNQGTPRMGYEIVERGSCRRVKVVVPGKESLKGHLRI